MGKNQGVSVLRKLNYLIYVSDAIVATTTTITLADTTTVIATTVIVTDTAGGWVLLGGAERNKVLQCCFATKK